MILRYHLLFAFALLGGFVSAEFARAQSKRAESGMIQARVEAKWNRAFEFRNGWTGGDGIGSVQLGPNRTLWMFGDSLIGNVEQGKHAAGTRLINNAIAVQTWNEGAEPGGGQIQFFWNRQGGDQSPEAWVVPNPERVKPTRTISDKKHPHGWYWPAGSGSLIAIGDQRKLIVFLFHVGRTEQDRGIWSFRNIGGAMLVIENPVDPPTQWKQKQYDLPFVVDSDRIRSDKNPESVESEFGETSWGMASLVLKPAQGKPSFLYVYGARQQSRWNRQLLLARVRVDQLSQFDRWTFYAGADRWSRHAEDAKPLASGAAPEFSVQSISYGGQTKLVMVQSDPMLGSKIYIRTANAPHGPWSDRVPVYDVPDVRQSKNYFAYAAKAHAAISPPGRLLISYVVNSTDFWQMLGDAEIYRPRFISIPLDALFEKSGKDSKRRKTKALPNVR